MPPNVRLGFSRPLSCEIGSGQHRTGAETGGARCPDAAREDGIFGSTKKYLYRPALNSNRAYTSGGSRAQSADR